MEHPQDSSATTAATDGTLERTSSTSHTETSQTAQEYIASQLRLEADAREALPYQFDTCTKPLGPLRHCHGEHNLVELFAKRKFVCDCGTTRLSNSGTPCSLRLNAETGRKGGVLSEEAAQGNRYNQNHEGKFCGCGEEYDPEKEKGTMFQCMGLGTVEEGGCGEDWWHPGCLMGLPRSNPADTPAKLDTADALETVKEEAEGDGEQTAAVAAATDQQDEEPLPSGFPEEDAFDHLICYKCANAFPWIKQYAGTSGFLPAVSAETKPTLSNGVDGEVSSANQSSCITEGKKRKAEDEADGSQDGLKKSRAEIEVAINNDANGSSVKQGSIAADTLIEGQSNPVTGRTPNPHSTYTANGSPPPRHTSLPSAPESAISLFLKDDFRDHFCRCIECFPRLAKHQQLLEEEDSYEPPLSEQDAAEDGNGSIAGRSVGSGSILERGEAALSSMDRVQAIEGVMAYNHVRDKVKAFLQPFAESGQAVSAEEVKAYFAKLRGDEAGLDQAAVGATGAGDGDHRREQGGY
ncbi:hypothetical protein B0A50_02666 [Salinomyces thailandicus]|uniref:Uncharacterized protein n=1 Tax=Salinomyces thailandicus TaxID=706561 RepID=A0A4V5N556_9PEZI|nr:hypothetical protein B0A50_02666 [Salinomyces thailandica]